MSRRILITGVSRGLGRAMLRGFTELGHVVHGCGTDPVRLDALRDEFPQQDLRAVDVADDAAVAAWADHVLPQGTPDLVLNNAARINTSRPLWEVDPQEFANLVQVNITGCFHVIRHFLPALMEQGRGVVVNFSSGWGRSTSPEVAPYCASKWAVEGLTKSLAQELPVGLAAIALNPGIIHTDMLDACFGASASSFPDPEQWAERAVPFLLGLGPEDNGRSADVPG